MTFHDSGVLKGVLFCSARVRILNSRTIAAQKVTYYFIHNLGQNKAMKIGVKREQWFHI